MKRRNLNNLQYEQKVCQPCCVAGESDLNSMQPGMPRRTEPLKKYIDHQYNQHLEYNQQEHNKNTPDCRRYYQGSSSSSLLSNPSLSMQISKVRSVRLAHRYANLRTFCTLSSDFWISLSAAISSTLDPWAELEGGEENGVVNSDPRTSLVTAVTDETESTRSIDPGRSWIFTALSENESETSWILITNGHEACTFIDG